MFGSNVTETCDDKKLATKYSRYHEKRSKIKLPRSPNRKKSKKKPRSNQPTRY